MAVRSAEDHQVDLVERCDLIKEYGPPVLTTLVALLKRGVVGDDVDHSTSRLGPGNDPPTSGLTDRIEARQPLPGMTVAGEHHVLSPSTSPRMQSAGTDVSFHAA